MPASVSSIDTPLWKAMEKSANTIVPGSRLVNYVMPGATDARFFRPSGTIIYGSNLFDPSLDFREYTKLFHGVNERISMTSLFINLQFYALCVKNMMVV